jgi:hypothetical protein
MKRILCAVITASLMACASAALSQDGDDWEFDESPAEGRMVAAVRYDGGAALVVQCRAGALTVLVAGLGQVDERMVLSATRADGRSDTQVWAPGGGPGVLRSEIPARDIRFMRGGGLYSLRSADAGASRVRADFDLPTHSANLDRVLSGCGWGLTDDRDQLTRASIDVSLVDPASQRPSRLSSASRRGAPRARGPSPSDTPVAAPAETQISCVVRERRLSDCRPDHARLVETRASERIVEALEGRNIFASDPAAHEGEVFYAGGARTITVVDYITVQSR